MRLANRRANEGGAGMKMKRIFAALLLLPFLALGADGSYEEGLEARRAGDYTAVS